MLLNTPLTPLLVKYYSPSGWLSFLKPLFRRERRESLRSQPRLKQPTPFTCGWSSQRKRPGWRKVFADPSSDQQMVFDTLTVALVQAGSHWPAALKEPSQCPIKVDDQPAGHLHCPGSFRCLYKHGFSTAQPFTANSERHCVLCKAPSWQCQNFERTCYVNETLPLVNNIILITQWAESYVYPMKAFLLSVHSSGLSRSSSLALSRTDSITTQVTLHLIRFWSSNYQWTLLTCNQNGLALP